MKFPGGILFLLFFLIRPADTIGQSGDRVMDGGPTYRETAERINDLIHTKLAVSFDFHKRQLRGKEWVTVKPHFYPVDSLQLDAKGMDILSVSLVKNAALLPLKYEYDGSVINIHLDRTYLRSERYRIFIEYTAKPEELKGRRPNEKGLYFINPDGTDKNKPVQVWTEGETENSSIWFPTIDKPNQKTTQDISMTVPSRFVTLSNGQLVSQKKNADGTRTDRWQLQLPHSPYLFMMAVGDFKIIRDKWRGKEVSYYVNTRHAESARIVFGETPEAIGFFSEVLGVPYPWNKYSQVVVSDYVSGAMENTTATVFGEAILGTKKELADRYYATGVAHELFHQWFGDYVTSESWSNLTLNESMAVLGELLWLEYKYGRDAADAHFYSGLKSYLSDTSAWTKDLVRFTYGNRQEVFDGVTYQKGGAILFMLRDYLGAAAFNEGLRLYLRQHALKAAEVHDLRLAFEEVSGKDLNWFFNQWFFGAGHPQLHISYGWDPQSGTQSVYIEQKQKGKPFVLPLTVDIYTEGRKENHFVWIREKNDTLKFHLTEKPLLINVDASKLLVATKTDDKPMPAFEFQYFHAPAFADRKEAVAAASRRPADSASVRIIRAAVHDRFYEIRLAAIHSLTLLAADDRALSVTSLRELATEDSNTLVRAAAIIALAAMKQPDDSLLFNRALRVESYAVQAAALTALAQIDPKQALVAASGFEQDKMPTIRNTVIDLYTSFGDSKQWPYVFGLFEEMPPAKKNNIIEQFARFTARVRNADYSGRGITSIKELGLIARQHGLGPKYVGLLRDIKDQRLLIGDSASATMAEHAIIELEKNE